MLERRQLLTSIIAQFADGSGTSLADQYQGTGSASDSSGWNGGWSTPVSQHGSFSSVAVSTTSPLNSTGNQKYLGGTFSVDHNQGGNGSFSRQYHSTGDITVSQPHRIEFDFRFDGTLTGFNGTGDAVYLFGGTASSSGPATTNTWMIAARGASGTIYWAFQNGDKAGGAGSFSNTTVALSAGTVYHFTVVVDPQNKSYSATVTDGGSGSSHNATMSNLGFRANATSTSFIQLGMALNTKDEAKAYSIDAIKITPTPPAAPSSLSATPASATQINLSWTDNASNEAGFEIDRATNSTFTSGLVTTTINTANTTSANITGLAANTTYYFRVRAINDGGASTYSSNASALTMPAAPSFGTVTGAGGMNISLTWNDVGLPTGGSPNYFSLETSTDNTNWSSSGTEDGQTFSALRAFTQGTLHYFRIRAHNASGYSAYSSVASSWTFPVAPTISASSSGASQIDVTWNGTAITGEDGFRLDVATTDYMSALYLTYAADTTGASVTTWGGGPLTPGYTYHVMVWSLPINHPNAFDGSPSDWVDVTTLATTPAGLYADNQTSTSLRLHWTDSTGETSYEIDKSTSSTFASGVTTTTAAANTTYADFTGLNPGTTYYFRIRSKNPAGVVSPNSSTLTSGTIVDVPSNFAAVATASTHAIKLTWTAVAGATYTIQRNTGPGGSFVDIKSGVTGTQYFDDYLNPDTAYQYKIKAVINGVSSAASSAASATTSGDLKILDSRLSNVRFITETEWGSFNPATNVATIDSGKIADLAEDIVARSQHDVSLVIRRNPWESPLELLEGAIGGNATYSTTTGLVTVTLDYGGYASGDTIYVRSGEDGNYAGTATMSANGGTFTYTPATAPADLSVRIEARRLKYNSAQIDLLIASIQDLAADLKAAVALEADDPQYWFNVEIATQTLPRSAPLWVPEWRASMEYLFENDLFAGLEINRPGVTGGPTSSITTGWYYDQAALDRVAFDLVARGYHNFIIDNEDGAHWPWDIRPGQNFSYQQLAPAGVDGGGHPLVTATTSEGIPFVVGNTIRPNGLDGAGATYNDTDYVVTATGVHTVTFRVGDNEPLTSTVTDNFGIRRIVQPEEITAPFLENPPAGYIPGSIPRFNQLIVQFKETVAHVAELAGFENYEFNVGILGNILLGLAQDSEDLTHDFEAIDDWHEAGEFLRDNGAFDEVDFLAATAGYLFQDVTYWWQQTANVIQEARRLSNYELPVYYFTSSEFDGPFSPRPIGGNRLPSELWRQMLAFATNEADGIVNWGADGSWDDEANVTTPYDWFGTTTDYVNGATAPPAAPVVSFSNHGGKLSWADVDNEDAYVIERSEAGGAFIPIARVPRDTRDAENITITWYDPWARPTSVLPNGDPYTPAYTYRVRAYNIAGASTSDEVGGTTLNRSAFGVNQAEYRDTADIGTNWYWFVGPSVEAASWANLRFDNVYFDNVAPDQLIVKMGGQGTPGHRLDIYMDGTASGNRIGSITIDGGGYVYTANVSLNSVDNAAHTIYIKGVDPNNPTGGASAGYLDWWQFRSSSAPASPTALTASRLSNNSIQLVWTDRSQGYFGNSSDKGETGFKIHRKITHPDGEVDDDVFTVGGDVTTWNDDSTEATSGNVEIRYYVAAYNASGESDPVWPIEAPAKPTVSTATDNQNRLWVQWTRDMIDGNDQIQVSWREVDTSTWTDLDPFTDFAGANPQESSGFYMGGLEPGRHYEVRARFIRGGVPSVWSDPSDDYTQPVAPTIGITGVAPDQIDVSWTVDEEQLTDGYAFWWGDPAGSQTGYPTYPNLLSADTDNVSFTYFGGTPIGSFNHDLFFDMIAALYGSSPTYGYWGSSRATIDLADRPTSYVVDPADDLALWSVGTSTSLTWAASESPDAEYNIYRGTSLTGQFTRLNDTPIEGLSFVDTTSLAAGNYIYVVRAALPHAGESYYDLSMPIYGVLSIGNSSANTFSAKLNTSTSKVDFYNSAPTGTPALSMDRAKVDSIAFAGGGGDDTFIVDIPATASDDLALAYDGGAGSNAITVAGTSGNDELTIDTDTAVFADSLMLFNNITTWNFDANGGEDFIWVFNEDVRFAADQGAESEMGMYVASDAVVQFDSTQHLSTLTVDDALVRLNLNGSRALILGALDIVGGQLDLVDNDMIVTGGALGTLSGSTYSGITGLIQSGRNGGGWTGDGIVTSMTEATASSRTTIGVADAASLLGISGTQTAVWNGYTVDASAILVKYTYAGDVNLTGTITGADFDIFDDAWNDPNWPGGYAHADVDYSGVFDTDDQFVIDSNYGYSVTHGPL